MFPSSESLTWDFDQMKICCYRGCCERCVIGIQEHWLCGEIRFRNRERDMRENFWLATGKFLTAVLLSALPWRPTLVFHVSVLFCFVSLLFSLCCTCRTLCQDMGNRKPRQRLIWWRRRNVGGHFSRYEIETLTMFIYWYDVQDTLDLFATLIVSLELSPHKQFFRTFPHSFTTYGFFDSTMYDW